MRGRVVRRRCPRTPPGIRGRRSGASGAGWCPAPPRPSAASPPRARGPDQRGGATDRRRAHVVLGDLYAPDEFAPGSARGSPELVVATRRRCARASDPATRARGAEVRVERHMAATRLSAQPVAATTDTCRTATLAPPRRVDEGQPRAPRSRSPRPPLLLQWSPRARHADRSVACGVARPALTTPAQTVPEGDGHLRTNTRNSGGAAAEHRYVDRRA